MEGEVKPIEKRMNFERMSAFGDSSTVSTGSGVIDLNHLPTERTDAYYRNINERQLDALIPLLRDYQMRRKNMEEVRQSMSEIADSIGVNHQTV